MKLSKKGRTLPRGKTGPDYGDYIANYYKKSQNPLNSYLFSSKLFLFCTRGIIKGVALRQ